MGRGQELYDRAKKIIPGGTQLLSKRPEMFLPDLWPSYYSRAKGCEVWDMDGARYYDFSLMGVGANVLGYAFDEVDDAAREAVGKGGMCTLNAPEEVALAEKLLELHPWAEMVRYAKAGGEAMSMAARIARAHTKKDIVLVCGYHGWHDWYLSANLAKGDPLKGVHLKGLEPLGVPRGLAGSNFIFHYNRYGEFERLVEEHRGEIAAVIMEPVRNDDPEDGFLEKIREVCTDEGMVLVFDEVSAGFRLCAGGSHLKLGIAPDMAVFAKAMTNGYPVAAVIGKGDAMQAAQDTFISSTFWTERIALAAALKSIECYEKYEVDKFQEHVGGRVKGIWTDAAKEAGLEIGISGMLPLIHFEFKCGDPLAYKTYFTQEMLKEGFLAATGAYASLAHKDAIIDQYGAAVRRVFARIGNALKEGRDIRALLNGPVCHAGFERLN